MPDESTICVYFLMIFFFVFCQKVVRFSLSAVDFIDRSKFVRCIPHQFRVFIHHQFAEEILTSFNLSSSQILLLTEYFFNFKWIYYLYLKVTFCL